MAASKASIEGLTGTAAVGAIGFLGVFLIVDAQLNLWTMLEAYTGSPTWGIVFAVPTLVLTYALGLILTYTAESVFQRIRKRSPEDEMREYLVAASLGNDAIIGRYNDLAGQRAFFEGCSLSLMILVIGLLSSARWLPGYESFTLLMSLGCVVMVAACPILAGQTDAKMRQIARFADGKAEAPR